MTNSCANDNLIDADVGRYISADVGGGSGPGSLVDVAVAPNDCAPLVSADVGDGLLSVTADVNEYSGVGLQVAALADQGLLGGDLLGNVGDVLPVGDLPDIALPDIGCLGVPDLPDLGGIIGSSSC
jgi:hypothetical protein